jgi:hypothetical protein
VQNFKEHVHRVCVLQFGVHLSTLVFFQDYTSVEIDIKPNLTISRDGVNVSHELEECSMRGKK